MAREAASTRDTYDEAIELLYYAHRALVGEPDRLLAERGLGRVHHRILYCIARAPGITSGGLCRVLGVTKQALHQPVASLLRDELVERSTDETNGRIRRLRLTTAGARLERRLADVQQRRFEAAFHTAGPKAVQAWRDVMRLLADGDESAKPAASAGHERGSSRGRG